MACCAGKDWNGAVAQMGERVVRNDEVRGSIPLGSTIPYMIDLSRMNRFYPGPRRGCATRSGFLFICPEVRYPVYSRLWPSLNPLDLTHAFS